MSERIDLGDGAYLEPDPEPRDNPFHHAILKTRPIPHTRAGHFVMLACGHEVMTFGGLEHAGGRLLLYGLPGAIASAQQGRSNLT